MVFVYSEAYSLFGMKGFGVGEYLLFLIYVVLLITYNRGSPVRSQGQRPERRRRSRDRRSKSIPTITGRSITTCFEFSVSESVGITLKLIRTRGRALRVGKGVVGVARTMIGEGSCRGNSFILCIANAMGNSPFGGRFAFANFIDGPSSCRVIGNTRTR